VSADMSGATASERRVMHARRGKHKPPGVSVSQAAAERHKRGHGSGQPYNSESMELEPTVDWASPLPDLSRPAVSHRIRIGDHQFDIAISGVQRHVPFEPDTHLVHIVVSYSDQPLTAYDLGLRSVEAGTHVWAYLTNRLTETVVQFYTPRPRDTGEMNPRLGCWGPRPDLQAQGLADSDVAIAVILGLSIWTPGANPPVDDQVFLEALRDTLVEVLSYWVVVARRTLAPKDRQN